MNKIIHIAIFIFIFGLIVFSGRAAFTSLHIFGDGICTTTNNTSGLSYYYGKRYTNGRVWVETLAQRLGLGASSITNVNWSNSSNNWSYYGQYSSNLIVSLTNFVSPPDVGTALFVVWVCDADSVYDMQHIFPSTNNATWTNAVNQSLINYSNIINSLYAKGARTLIMPNAVDITEVPEYAGLVVSEPATRNFIRQEMIYFNTAFSVLLNQARASLPEITIYEPDYFSLLDNVLTNATTYGLTNALSDGYSTYAVAAGKGSITNLDGPGTNYIFWDEIDPTAKVHEILADAALQMIAPVQINAITALSTSSSLTNMLSVTNMPVGLNGFVDGTMNIAQPNWIMVTNVSSSNLLQSIVVNAAPSTNGFEFYRLRFPYAWSWP